MIRSVDTIANDLFLSLSALARKYSDFLSRSSAAVSISPIIHRQYRAKKCIRLTIDRSSCKSTFPVTMAASALNNNGTDADDYLDELARLFPWHRSFTSLERLLIVLIVSCFVTLVGCTLLCLIYPQSPLRQRFRNRKKVDATNTLPRKSILVVPPPPSYESLVKADNLADLNKLSTSRYFNSVRKSSNGTMSDSDGVLTNSVSIYLMIAFFHRIFSLEK